MKQNYQHRYIAKDGALQKWENILWPATSLYTRLYRTIYVIFSPSAGNITCVLILDTFLDEKDRLQDSYREFFVLDFMVIGDSSVEAKARLKPGLSLVDTIIAIVVVAFVIIGSANFKYFAVRDAVRAERQIVAARTALMFCEAWRGCGGAEDFDPDVSFDGIIALSPGTVLNAPNDYTVVGSFNTTLDDVAQNITLSYRDISSQLRALNTSVSWSRSVDESGEVSLMDEYFELTTYCQK